MIIQTRETSNSLTDCIVSIIKDSRDVFSAAVGTIGSAAQKIIDTTGDTDVYLIERLAFVIRHSLEGVINADGKVDLAVKGMATGILQAGKITGKKTADAMAPLTELVISTTYESGGDVDKAMKGIVEAILENVDELEMSLEELLSQIAMSGVGASFRINYETGRSVRSSLTEIIVRKSAFIKQMSQRAVASY